jgi:hypothetical protein
VAQVRSRTFPAITVRLITYPAITVEISIPNTMDHGIVTFTPDQHVRDLPHG